MLVFPLVVSVKNDTAEKRRKENSTVGTWEHRVITADVPALVPSVFPVCSQCVGTRNRGENGVMKGFIERKKSVFPMFSLFFYI